MEFYRKYELIEPLPGEGTRVFRAKQAATGREVAVHLLVGGRTPENEALLARLRALPPAAIAKLIEVGDNEGTPYVVTVAPPYLHLEEWLREQERAGPPPDAKKYSRAGTWKIPTIQEGAPGAGPRPSTQPSAPPESRAAQPGEFTQMFQSPAGLPPEPPARPGPPAAPGGPGAFTQLLQAAGTPQPAPPVVAKSKLAPQPAVPAAPAAPAGAGEFTRMFRAAGVPPPAQPVVEKPKPSPPPAVPAAPAPPVAPAAPSTGPSRHHAGILFAVAFLTRDNVSIRNRALFSRLPPHRSMR